MDNKKIYQEIMALIFREDISGDELGRLICILHASLALVLKSKIGSDAVIELTKTVLADETLNSSLPDLLNKLDL